RKFDSDADLFTGRAIGVRSDLIRRQIRGIRIEPADKSAERAAAHLRKGRFIDIIVLNVLQNRFKNAYLRAGVVYRLLCPCGQKLARERQSAYESIDRNCGRNEQDPKFSA